MPKLTIEEARDKALAQIRAASESPCLWPSHLSGGTFEEAWEFVKCLHTWNEAEQEIQRFPDLPYLQEIAREWWECKDQGKLLIVEKCRRMVVSWLCRGLTLYAMGLKRTDVVLAGDTYEASCKHVWRYKFLYENLSKRHGSWRLPPSKEIKWEGDKKLKVFSMPNGSVVTAINSDPESVRGDGVAIVELEEFSGYKLPKSTLAQAKIITKGSAGSVGGFIVAIANASPNMDWQDIKRGGDGRD